MVSAPAAQTGTLHRYSKRLVAFEHSISSGEPENNVMLWIGGLGDGLHTVSYPALLDQRLPSGWTLAQVQLLSSLNGWGTGSLQRDVKEIAQCVEYFKKTKAGKFVLMGHSTGCQDVMEYVTGQEHERRPAIDGAILQAPVSDRQALFQTATEAERDLAIKVAKQYVAGDRSNDCLPEHVYGNHLGRAPVSAYRWLSLLSPGKDGDDDYFSSDLPAKKLQKSFGAFPPSVPLLVLFSGADEHVPDDVDVQKMVNRWQQTVNKSNGVWSRGSGIISGAHHNLEQDEDEPLQDLVSRVLIFIEEDSGLPRSVARI